MNKENENDITYTEVSNSGPNNGLEYKPHELIKIANDMDKSISHGRLITYDNKLIPVNCVAASRVLQRHKAGETARDEWRKVGRNKMVEDTELYRRLLMILPYIPVKPSPMKRSKSN